MADTEREAIGVVQRLFNLIDKKTQEEKDQKERFVNSRALADKVIGKREITRPVKVVIYGIKGDLYLERLKQPSKENDNNKGNLQISFKENGPVPNERRVTKLYFFDEWSITSVEGKLTTPDHFARVNSVLELIKNHGKKTQLPGPPLDASV